MPDVSPPVDRRARLKARTRRSIVDAAAALMQSTRGLDFTVDELAERADVARRTVFNHFASIDDVMAAVLADAFHSVVDALDDAPVPQADDPRAAVAADAARALRSADLVPALSSLTRGLGIGDWAACAAEDVAVPAHQVVLLLRSLVGTSDDLADALHRRHPGVERIDVDLVVGSMTSNLVVLHRYWFARTGGADDAASRAAWADLLDRMVHLTGTTGLPAT
ncbi:TetR/AcrR family transcriptional regulator [Cellulosimicrobium marinum]|uniref:TetR/AcrR family transcriptional regulator n=1 Tax=Cellulosimicrobium marinum TaxID=1638992 RepID=UPI001E3BB528|nr:TetR/AcrR family transcriptional regulator [Cellulosimicrobium marinum]MCB7135591.1 TetR/AcrR family transcriptional regulator [Cellulosimicrobium marinum]